MNVLITGGNGFIAKNIKNSLKSFFNIDTISRQDFNLLDTNKVNDFFKNKFYDVIIHTAIAGGSRLKEDSPSIVYENTLMLYNILDNKSSYRRLINLGSGAELTYPKTPYGMSKNIISNTIKPLKEHYNLRIFAVFSENELNTRFIKSNILRYLNKKNLIIHQNKFMDFFSLNDFIKVIKMYITAETIHLDKTFDCCYNKKYSLLDIANIINSLDDYKVNINILNSLTTSPSYTGNNPTKCNLKYYGLESSIRKVFKALKKNKLQIS
jgi:dTDP-4-dehydrorhamnose reductase